MKKILFSFMISLLQTIAWSFCLMLKYKTLEPNGKLIIGTIFPILIFIFFIIGLLQNISNHLNNKWFNWVTYIISISFLVLLFCFPFHKYHTLVFLTLTIGILMIPKLNDLKLQIK